MYKMTVQTPSAGRRMFPAHEITGTSYYAVRNKGSIHSSVERHDSSAAAAVLPVSHLIQPYEKCAPCDGGCGQITLDNLVPSFRVGHHGHTVRPAIVQSDFSACLPINRL